MERLEICRPAEIKEVQIQDTFWSQYMELVRDTVIPYQWEILNDRVPDVERSHAVRNFKIAAGVEKGCFYGEVFQDSDLAKWLEAASYCLESAPEPELEAVMDEVIDLIAAAQQENGYLDTYFSIGNQEKEWTNLYECHEMYCAGHMMEAAAAYFRATGKRKLLDVMCRCADHIAEHFRKGGQKGYPGHQEIELALVKLYEATGNREYLELSRYFLEERGREPNYFVWEWETLRQQCSFRRTCRRRLLTWFIISHICLCMTRLRQPAMRSGQCICTQQWQMWQGRREAEKCICHAGGSGKMWWNGRCILPGL